MTLFDLPPAAARHTDPPTSHQAAAANPAGRALLADRILQIFVDSPHLMFTDDELALAMPDAYPPSLIKRRGELVAAGWLVNAGFTRLSRRGSAQIVWKLSA